MAAVLDPDAWAGGNYAAEALFGIYNPLNLLIWVFMSAVPNLMLAHRSSSRASCWWLLALGTYLLAREYGAERWAAAVVAIALPVSRLHALLGRRVVAVRA